MTNEAQRSADVHTARIPLQAWNELCMSEELQRPPTFSASERTTLAASGVLTPSGDVDRRWRGLVRAYRAATASVRMTAVLGNVAFQSSTALGAASISVVTRRRLALDADGSQRIDASEDQVEVSATLGHPWALIARVIPPIPAFQSRGNSPADPQAPAPAGLPDPAVPPTTPTDLRPLPEGQALVAYTMTSMVDAVARVRTAWFVATASGLFRAGTAPYAGWRAVPDGTLESVFAEHVAELGIVHG